jgi:DNA-binding transcriptional regulator LsrR (DeoR family)
MDRINELRLVSRISRMYYERKIMQPDIAKQLGLSQATVSRLLKKAKEEGIIRISVSIPKGVYSELEEKLIQLYDLRDAIVVDTIREDDEQLIIRDLGSAAAYYFESILKPNEVIGISSWSSVLLALVDSMHPSQNKTGVRVVQILGGIGNPSAEVHATHLTSRLADLLKGNAVFLPAPGVVGSEAARKIINDDIYVIETTKLFDQIDTALVGIGALEPSKLLSESGNVFSKDELEILRQNGAVGDILLHFYNKIGDLVITPLDNRVISMSLHALSKVPRSIGVAGGRRKYAGILGALKGKWINILITDQFTANRLIKDK